MPQIFLAIGVLAVSTSPLLIRLAQPVSPLTIAASRVLIAGIILGLIGGRQWKQVATLSARELLLFGLSGLALATHFALWIWSLALTSTTASVSLVATQPIFAGVFGWLLLGEGFRRQELLGIALAAVGCVILAGGDLGGTSSRALLGDALSIGGAITVPIYLLIGRFLRERVPLLAYLSFVNLVAGACLLVVGLGIGEISWSGFSQGDYLALIGLGLVPSVIGHTSLNYCVRFVPVHLVSLGILVEPVAAALSTWLVFAEVPPVHAAVGGAIIVVGIYAGFGRQAPAPA